MTVVSLGRTWTKADWTVRLTRRLPPDQAHWSMIELDQLDSLVGPGRVRLVIHPYDGSVRGDYWTHRKLIDLIYNLRHRGGLELELEVLGWTPDQIWHSLPPMLKPHVREPLLSNKL